MPNPAITESEDYLSQFDANGASNQQAKKPTPDELMQKLYSMRVPEPTFDQDKADRLQKIANINQAGRGLNVLGGILATGLGAPVRRSAPDSTAPALYQSYQANLDKYKAEKDANLLRNYQKDVEDVKYGLSNAYRDQQIELANKKQADWMKAKEMDSNLNFKKWAANYDLEQKKLAQKTAHDKAMEAISATRAEKAGKKDKPEKPFNPIQVKDNMGNLQKLPEGEWTKIYNEALGDSPMAKEFRDKNMKTLDAMFKSQPDVYQKEIARAYYEYMNRPENLERQALDAARQAKGMPTSGQNVSELWKNQTQQPKTKPAQQPAQNKNPFNF